MTGWDSTSVIGNVEQSFDAYTERENERGPFPGNPLWRAYYNGWIEGRMDMLAELELQKQLRNHRDDLTV